MAVSCEEVLKRIRPDAPTTTSTVVVNAPPAEPPRPRQLNFPYNAYRQIQTAILVPVRRPRGAAALADLPTFGAFGVEAQSSAVDLAKAQLAIAELRAGYAVGAVKLSIVTVGTPYEMLWNWVVGPTDAQQERDHLRELYRQLGKQIDSWATDLYAYAKTGIGGAGQPYTWDEWASLGNDLADQVVAIPGVAWNVSTFKNALGWLKQVKDIAPNPTLWPTWLKVVAGIAAVAGGAYVLNSVVQAKRAFLPSAE